MAQPHHLDLESLLISSIGANEKFTINSHFLKWIFEIIGAVNVNEDVIIEVSRSISFKIYSIITEAKKYCQKSNRSRMICADIDNSIKNFGLDNFLLNDSVYNFSSLTKIISSNRSVSDIYFFCDEEVDIDEYLSESRLKIRPLPDVSLKSHWLAISGVQPCIAENPSNTNLDSLFEGIKSKFDCLPLSFHLQAFYKDITEASIGTLEDKRKEALLALQRDHSIKYLLVPLCSFIYQGIRVNIASRNLAILIYVMRMVCSIIQNGSIPPEIMESHFGEIIPSIMSCIISPDLCSKRFEENHWALRVYSAKLICNLCSNYDSYIPHFRGNIVELLNTVLTRSQEELIIDDESLTISYQDKPFDILNFQFGTYYGIFYTISLMPREVMIVNTLKYAKRLSKFFEAIYKQLNSMNHEPLTREVLKVENQLIQNISSFTLDSEISNRNYLEEKVGTYLTEKLCKSFTDLNNNIL